MAFGMNGNEKAHWDHVFATKSEQEVSWFQKTPKTSLALILELNIPKDAKIIDVGGGDSYLIDELLEYGFTNLYLLDISKNAIERAKKRLHKSSDKISFIVSSNTDFNSDVTFDVWHDRASFHFLTEKKDIDNYASIVQKHTSPNASLILGTFSENGPKKCSGLDITQYNENKMKSVFQINFEFVKCITEDHKTPFDTIQDFIFCTFKKK